MNFTENQTVSERDWMSAPLGLLVGHILEMHHKYLRAELPRLAEASAKVLEAHLQRHGDTLLPLRNTLLELKNELESHMWKEEMVLFPLISGLEQARAAGRPAPAAHCGSVRNPIGVMEREHDGAGRALAEMRRITANYTLPEDAGDEYRAFFDGLGALERDLERHIQLENEILFPRAVELEAGVL